MSDFPTRAEIEQFIAGTPRVKRIAHFSMWFIAGMILLMLILFVFYGAFLALPAAIYMTWHLIGVVRIGQQVREAESWMPILRAGLPLFRTK